MGHTQTPENSGRALDSYVQMVTRAEGTKVPGAWQGAKLGKQGPRSPPPPMPG